MQFLIMRVDKISAMLKYENIRMWHCCIPSYMLKFYGIEDETNWVRMVCNEGWAMGIGK